MSASKFPLYFSFALILGTKNFCNGMLPELPNPSLADMWQLNEPLWGYDADNFELRYRVNDMIEDSMVDWSFWDKNCQEGGVPIQSKGQGYEIRTNSDGSSPGVGFETREFLLTFDSTVDIKNNTDLFRVEWEDADSGNFAAVVELCARIALKTPGTNGVEVNYLETLMTLRYELTSSFIYINDVDIRPGNANATKVKRDYKMRAFDCSQNSGKAKGQGQVVRVCIEPDPRAVAEGYRMRYINSFKFRKESKTNNGKAPKVVEQDAVVNRGNAKDKLSRLSCERGRTQCLIETMLKAQFYDGDGIVSAVGTATMQYGQATDQRRALQVTGIASGGAEDDEPPASLEEEVEVPFQVIARPPSPEENPSSWFHASFSGSEDASKAATIAIIALAAINALSLFVLAAQHPRFKGSKLYLT